MGLQEAEKQETLAEKLEKLREIEVGAGRHLKGIAAPLVSIVAVAMSFFHIYVLIFQAIDPYFFRSFHVAFAGTLTFALYPGWKKAPQDRLHWIDLLLILFLLLPIIYMVIEFDSWIFRVGVLPDTLDFIFSLIFVLVILEITRRATGWVLTIFAILFILYGYLGPYMPGILVHRGYHWPRLITFLCSLEGILGVPVMASATYVFLFVLFGAFIEISGTGRFFVDFALSIAGRYRGGPAKVSIISSALFGTASGSAVANVVVDGVFNIPLMKASGFRPTIAGAIEAMTSTGGQITPPVMGAGAFLMAEILGIPYAQIALAAVIPCLLYYSASFWMIDFESAKMGIKGLGRADLPGFFKVLRHQGYLLGSLVVLFYFIMVEQISPFRSAMWAIVTVVIVSWLGKVTRMDLKKIWKAIEEGGRRSVEIAATCAAAGIIVGVLSLTGLGMKFAMIIINYSGGNLLIALIFSMIVALILGMGMPTTAAYAISASILAPAIIKMGVPPLGAHLFIFYFACVSALTPPVALAAYAAAAIANAPMWAVGCNAVRLAIAGFILPYMFIYGPAMILVGEGWEIAFAFITGLVGTLCLAGAVQGWLLHKTTIVERVFLLAAAILLIKPGWMTDLIGLVILGLVALSQYLGTRRRDAIPPPSEVPLKG